ncbi:trypsin-like peptidase domain-containing protein [Streptosporangiaceae bacterium NEAU-GS5]|nr:trypsin-like peptidase domain-containing protein [Streptosporangiaceae bacterium NEAU-GS5]
MRSVFADYPLDFARPELRALRDLLAQSIYRTRELEDVVLGTGLNPGAIDFGGSALMQWRSVLTEARAQERIESLLEVVRQTQPTLGVRIDELLGPQPVLAPGTGLPDQLSDPKGAGWRGFGAERRIVSDFDTLLGIAFLATGLERSRSICRITATFGAKRSHATASLVAPDLLLTNHHALYDWEAGDRPASGVEAWFDYELDPEGVSRQMSVVPCDASTIDGGREHDWAIVRTKIPPPPTSAVLDLHGAAPPRREDYVFIIQHPEGGPKKIGLSHNLVRHVDDDVLQYWTDTRTGSSGAPVFDSNWRVVGLHHRWVTAPEGEGVAYRNQGRRIERVLAGLSSRGIEVSTP